MSCSNKVKEEEQRDPDTEAETSTVESSGSTTNTNGGTASITVGTDLTFSDITKTGFTVSWGEAASGNSTVANLEYQLVTASTTGELDTLTKAEAVDSANIVMAYTAATLSFTVTGLTPSETRVYAVIVRDTAGQKALYTVASVTTLALDAPTVGTAITFGLITDTSFSIYWGAATSDVTVQNNLQYRVVMASDSSTISTIAGANAVTGNMVVLDWTANRVGASYVPVGEVQGAQTFAVAVLVKDENGTTALYSPKSITTLPHKLIFATNTLQDPSTLGLSGGVVQADAICNGQKPAGRGNFKAMITIAATREACRTHANCLLNSTVLTNDGVGWVMTPNTSYENSSGSLIFTTNAAGIFVSNGYSPGKILPASTNAWTGLNSDWTTGANCSNWTSNASNVQGAYGYTDYNFSPMWGLGNKGCNGWLQAGGSYNFAALYCVEQ